MLIVTMAVVQYPSILGLIWAEFYIHTSPNMRTFIHQKKIIQVFQSENFPENSSRQMNMMPVSIFISTSIICTNIWTTLFEVKEKKIHGIPAFKFFREQSSEKQASNLETGPQWKVCHGKF